MFIGYLVVGLCALGHFGVQAKLSVTFDDFSIDLIDPKYFNNEDILATIDGDDVFSVGFTIIKPIPARARGHFTLFGLSMGEYVVPTGLDVEMSVCELMIEPIILGPIFNKMGFSKESCPVPPGSYELRRYKLPVDTLPDEFEENKYQGKCEMAVDGKVILSVRFMIDVTNVYE